MLIGYARVSTSDQSMEGQIRELHLAGCKRIFKDTMSGVEPSREGLNNLLYVLRSGDTVVVCRLDRLGRSLRDLIDITSMIEKSEAQLHSLNEGIDTRSPAGRFIFHIFAALAEFERNLIRQRTMEGLRAAQLAGIKTGRSHRLKDYEIRQLIEWYQDPLLPINTICRRAGIARQTLYNYMEKEGIDKIKRKY